MCENGMLMPKVTGHQQLRRKRAAAVRAVI
jgi:hypothetical protein